MRRKTSAREQSAAESQRRTTTPRLSLLRTFELVCGADTIPVPLSAQRVLAFVALHRHPLRRAYVSGSLWLETSEERAQANLRSALWRLHRSGCRLVEADGSQLRLGPSVEVDLREAEALARRAIEGADVEPLDVELAALDGDLLPDWYDDWVLVERERYRQLRLRALDSLCERLTRAGRLLEALEAGQAAVAADPLRESAHRALVRVHLAEGNPAEAIRQYTLFRRMLRERLGIAPSLKIEQLIRGIGVMDPVW